VTYRIASDAVIAESSDRNGWQRTRLPDEVGRCFVDRMLLMPGISLVYTDYLPCRDIVEESRINRDQAVLAITIGLAGGSGYVGNDDERFRFEAGHATVTSFRRMNGERRYRGEEHVRQLRLLIDADALDRHALGQLIDADSAASARLMHYGRCRPALFPHIRSLEDAHGKRTPSPIELQIAALTLLLEESRDLGRSNPPSTGSEPSWSTAEEDKLRRARTLLQEHFARPLTIAHLCRTVGLNEFKLKKGFRELFGTSPHRMLTEIRMAYAREALARGEPVSNVAYDSGYQHPANFSAAFSRFYGAPPSALRGTVATVKE
jgi:AraC-like DNA-binding protein